MPQFDFFFTSVSFVAEAHWTIFSCPVVNARFAFKESYLCLWLSIKADFPI